MGWLFHATLPLSPRPSPSPCHPPPVTPAVHPPPVTPAVQGFISYGTGLMVEAATMTDTFPPVFDELGTYMGHGGDTYGFLSEQGLVYGLNASMSVIANQDGESSFVQAEFMCRWVKKLGQGVPTPSE